MTELPGRPREELDELAGWRGETSEHTGMTALTWSGTDGEAVHHAVPDQRGRGEDADAWVVNVARVLTLVPAVDRRRAFDNVQC
jgi:hypothetical protein